MKPIRISNHALKRMAGRGATETEILDTIRFENWEPALDKKFQARKTFAYNQRSPVNQKVYNFKTVHAIFADEEKKSP
jgi:hypothetical protein